MIKRDALDAVFSDLIREAHDWTCARCGREFPDRKGQDAHCSHFYSRKYNSTRWFPDNAVLLCASCHRITTDDHHEHVRLFESLLGETRYAMLVERKAKLFRYRKADKDAMKAHYKSQLENLKAHRTRGATGVLAVAAYD